MMLKLNLDVAFSDKDSENLQSLNKQQSPESFILASTTLCPLLYCQIRP